MIITTKKEKRKIVKDIKIGESIIRNCTFGGNVKVGINKDGGMRIGGSVKVKNDNNN